MSQVHQVGGGTTRGREVGGWEVEINRSQKNDNNVNVNRVQIYTLRKKPPGLQAGK